VVWLVVGGGVWGCLGRRFPRRRGLLLVLGGGGLGYGLAIWGAFVHFALWLPLLVPLGFQLPATAGFVLWRRLWVAEQLRRQLEGYLPVWIKAWPTDARGMPTPANQEVSGVCLSTDLAGYTRISEGYRPTDLHTFVNDYFAGLFEVVYHHRGWVSDIKGDGMLALWVKNAPEVVLRQRACEAALAIVDALKGRDETQLPTRLGLHGGSVALGVVGSPRHWEFRALGDPVNTVQRIQELNKSLKTQVLASRETLDGVEDVVYCPVGRFRLRGKRQILELVELWRTGRPTSAEQATIEACNNALACWRRGDFVAAQRGFAALASRGVAPAGFYLKRCHGLARQPVPKGWNGVVEGV
ncbi:MAG: adenylate/guanylate cyclase domain-containing protein, partial [Candidatus Competibacterales bacterium]